MNALWSAERSGNTWIRFIIEYLTGQPTQGCVQNYKDVPICRNRFPNDEKPLKHVDLKAPYILTKSHKPFPLTETSFLIISIRDYHEYISFPSYISEPRLAQGDEQYYLMYLDIIEAYHKFKGKKMLIYYEDLINHPSREILRIKDFLGTSQTRYRDFVSRLDDYTEMCKKATARVWGGSSSGKDFCYHRNKISKESIKQKLAHFHELLNKPKYHECVRNYIARYNVD